VEVHLFQGGEHDKLLANDGLFVGGLDTEYVAAYVGRFTGVWMSKTVEVCEGLGFNVESLLWAFRTVADVGSDVVNDFFESYVGEGGPSGFYMWAFVRV